MENADGGGAGVAATADTSTLRWQLEDGCSDGLGVWARFFDETQSSVWPNAGEVYQVSAGGAIDRTLSCTTGHKVCYGAQPADDSTLFFWGVGVSNDKGCDNCCFACTTATISRRVTC
jgi:hypothetical protein